MIVDFLYLSYILDVAIFETNFLSLFNANFLWGTIFSNLTELPV